MPAKKARPHNEARGGHERAGQGQSALVSHRRLETGIRCDQIPIEKGEEVRQALPPAGIDVRADTRLHEHEGKRRRTEHEDAMAIGEAAQTLDEPVPRGASKEKE